MSNEQHSPDPEFISRLQWQLRSEYRRRQRFDSNGAWKGVRYGWLRTAALVLVSLSLGVAGVKAAQHLENSWRKDLLLARSEASSELARARLQINQEMLDTVAKQFQAGLASRHELGYAEMEVKQAQLELKRLELSMDEMQLSGSPPRQELSAPLIAGRDYVSQRLEIDQQESQHRSDLARQEFERILERAEVGLANQIEVAYFEQELKKLEMHSDAIRRSLNLREAFLNGEISAREVELTEMLIQAQNRQGSAASKLQALHMELDRVARRFKVGTASELDLRQFEFQTKVAETEARLAETEVKLLQRELEQ